MLINATVPEELRIAVVEDGELVDLDIESTEGSSIKGNIYKGVVHNVEASLAAAFINFGDHKQGFLPFDEVAPSLYGKKWDKKEPPRITDVLKRGQEIIVQAAKDPVGEKGAALTTYLSIPGRFTVLMPGSDARGISRKVEDGSSRKQVKAIAEQLTIPEDCGFIVRTAGLDQSKEAIQKDIDRLAEIHQTIERTAKIARAPSILHSEPDLIVRTLRELFTEEIEEVLIDSREEYEATKAYFEELMPQYVDRIKHHINPIPIFTFYHVEEQVEATFQRIVPLPSGGSIVIDETEAMTAIDVNSGKMTSERDHEDTVFKTNLEAAHVIAQQLRLRDHGGIVVIDFIDMEMSKHNREVEEALKDAAAYDKARLKVSRILSNGLCILTRQRIRGGIKKTTRHRCPACGGTGWLRSPESHSLSLLKRIEARLAQGEVEEVRVSTHKMTAEYLLNYKRSELLGLERQYRCRILVVVKLELDRATDEVKFLSKGELLQEMTDKLPPREKRKKLSERKKKKPRGGRSREDGRGREDGERRGPRPPRAAPPAADRGPAPEPPTEGGVTFTGRPPKELLEKIKRDAEERRKARAGRGPVKDGEDGAARTALPPDPPPPSERPPSSESWTSAFSVPPVEVAEDMIEEARPSSPPDMQGLDNGPEVEAQAEEAETSSDRPSKPPRKGRTRARTSSRSRSKKSEPPATEEAFFADGEEAVPGDSEADEPTAPAAGGGFLKRLLGNGKSAARDQDEG